MSMDINACFFYLLLIIKCFLVGFSMAAETLTTDKIALLQFKDQIVDPHNFLSSNWSSNSSSSSVCNWVGVSCNSRHGRVRVLDLSEMGLSGSISPFLGNLSFLVSLNLSGNNFQGSLPQELANLLRFQLIDLSFNAFNGEIPSWLGALNQVQNLVLSNNNFTGIIPSSLANMSNLETLDLGYNLIQGNIPNEIGFLRKLKTFKAQDNQLVGPVPSSIFNISSLQSISLIYNNLSGSLPDDMCYRLPQLDTFLITWNHISGHIPSSIGECRKLQLLSLYNNRFTGTIPRSMGNLTELRMVYLGINYLEGEIPSEIGNLPTLEIFSANQNMRLVGSIPASIFNISSLQEIYLYDNQLTGKLPCTSLESNLESLTIWGNYLSGNIPDCISNPSKLQVLSLNLNSFSGLIPSSLGNLSSLEELRLWGNNFTTESPNHEWKFLSPLANCKNLTLLEISSNPLNGVLPTSISNLSISLQIFRASDCNIQGSIPMETGSLSNLMALELSLNEFIGSIPPTIGRLQNLQSLSLIFNNLQGSIPFSVCSLERLNELQLSGNMLEGPIPSCLGNLTSLRSLYLDSNKLNSTIPSNFWSLEDILRVDLSSNHLSGSLPLELGNLKVLIYLNLSWNSLSGDIPVPIGGLNGLQTLSLSNNRLQGPIPESVGDLTSLETLDLSNNNLSGIIPKSLEGLSYLRYLNVAFNRLEGEIPTEGSFHNFTAQSFMNNYALCGPPEFQVPPCKNSTNGPSKTSPMHVLRYVLPIVASIIVIVTIIIVFKQCKNRSTNLSSTSGIILEIQNRNLYNRLLQATDGFSEDNLLGSGSFGSVYKGTVSNGKNVAIKVFNLQLEGAFKSFDVECEVLQNILHRNLVKIVSSCSCIDFKALVLEFMPNGSLEKWLYSDDVSLDILQRIDIMIDVASALEYLHLGHPNPIIHCDLKPSNILLDIDMVAHVGDFGIAKLLGEAESVKETMTLATIGYMAPEYGSTGIVSIKSDVYSYGILVMETFTRKRPTDEIFSGEMSIKHWVKESLSNGLLVGVVDSSLLETNKEDIKAKTKCISSIMRLALDCSAELPADRNDMEDVVSILKKIKTEFMNDISQA